MDKKEPVRRHKSQQMAISPKTEKQYLQEISECERKYRSVLNQRSELLEQLRKVEYEEIRLQDELNALKQQFREIADSGAVDPSGKMTLRQQMLMGRSFSCIFKDKNNFPLHHTSSSDIVGKEYKRMKMRPMLLDTIQADDPSLLFAKRAIDDANNANLLKEIPEFKIHHSKDNRILATIEGPDQTKVKDPLDQPPKESYLHYVYARSISTYPVAHDLPKRREGEPICDQWKLWISKTKLLVALGDGCNWGERPCTAAKKATAGFLKYMNDHQSLNLQEAGHQLLRAVSQAHNSIIEGLENVWDAGTTTLCGGLLTKLHRLDNKQPVCDTDPQWMFVGVSVGDCKTFHWSASKKKVSDLTEGNRTNLADASDPGGRIGPHLNGGIPDLRNLDLYVRPLYEGDILLIVSDGVHDNLDPQMIGKSPSDFNIPSQTWDEAAQAYPEECENAKNEWRKSWLEKELKKLRKANNKKLSPSQVVEHLLAYCVDMTKAGREFLETNLNKRVPDDHKAYPGKMDHTTCIAIEVPGRSFKGRSDKSSSSDEEDN